MPYVGGSLASLFGKVPQAATAKCAEGIARKGGDRLRELAEMNTPVKTGKLRGAWKAGPVVRGNHLFGPSYSVAATNDTDYAAYVEEGTGLYGPKHAKYEIKPKDPAGTLAFKGADGKWVFAKRVMHPGSRGNHMLAIAAHVVEFEVDSGMLAQAELEEWARAVEDAAD